MSLPKKDPEVQKAADMSVLFFQGGPNFWIARAQEKEQELC